MSNVVEHAPQTQDQDATTGTFHLRMAWAALILLIISAAGCRFTSIQVADIGGRAIAVLTASAMLLPLPAYWHQKHRPDWRDATLTIPWALLFAVILPFPVLIAAKLHMPLRDSLFAGVDQWLGISVPGIAAWASHDWLGSMVNRSYALLIPLLPAAFLAPALAGKAKHAEEFLLSNLIAFTIGVSLFALFPAVGPWYAYHQAGNGAQMFFEAQFFALRFPGTYVFHSQPLGLITFPSFHVIWAILCTTALWGFRSLRVPISLLSGMMIASTMTTGWHYFSDVLGGIAVATLSILLAKAYSRSTC